MSHAGALIVPTLELLLFPRWSSYCSHAGAWEQCPKRAPLIGPTLERGTYEALERGTYEALELGSYEALELGSYEALERWTYLPWCPRSSVGTMGRSSVDTIHYLPL